MHWLPGSGSGSVRAARALALVLLAFACAPWPIAAHAADVVRDRALIDAAVAAMPDADDEAPVLYVVGVAGDGTEDVFRNEVRFLETGVAPRLGASARTLSLVNHVESLTVVPRPLATGDALRHALEALGRRMRPQDLLLLYLTMHGAPDHRLGLTWPPHVDESLAPKQLRAMLDAVHTGTRVVVVSACYSGGFVPALRSPDTLLITAARADRPSFGCGSESSITFFGHAWLLDGLNADRDFAAAFQAASRAVAARESALGFTPSRPQIDVGKRVRPQLARWLATLAPVPAADYPYPID
ncbi:C13 family peptidase [Luteimonas deserti]|uniref:Peptidase C13 n=1 Tax=Luteimonas deserti TaxID=2752306 RepID=A0A7Z0QSR6_9GAMM|nr:C13 family peptidase [Luteimonas deserti]NYZ63137.1 peptidase C13 [Luteimonas deserti]